MNNEPKTGVPGVAAPARFAGATLDEIGLARARAMEALLGTCDRRRRAELEATIAALDGRGTKLE